MYWDQTTTNGLLSSIPAGGSGTLKFTFTAPSAAMLASATNPDIVISLSAAGQRTDQSGVPQNLQAALSQTIGITTDLEFAAQGLYYANPFGSTGPIPPKAGTGDDLCARLHRHQHDQRDRRCKAYRRATAVRALAWHVFAAERKYFGESR